MAKAKLLFFLIILHSKCFANCCGSNMTNELIDLVDKGNEKIMEESFGYKNMERLMVFVSFSMPDSSLKEYMREAKKYGAELFVIGIPGGNIRNFANKVTGMIEDDMYGISIDEREFDKYQISQVPTMVLARESYMPNKLMNLTYDKVAGHITIKKALEFFADSGEMSSKAKDLLDGV